MLRIWNFFFFFNGIWDFFSKSSGEILKRFKENWNTTRFLILDGCSLGNRLEGGICCCKKTTLVIQASKMAAWRGEVVERMKKSEGFQGHLGSQISKTWWMDVSRIKGWRKGQELFLGFRNSCCWIRGDTISPEVRTNWKEWIWARKCWIWLWAHHIWSTHVMAKRRWPVTSWLTSLQGRREI